MSGYSCTRDQLGNLTVLLGSSAAQSVCSSIDVQSLGVQGAALAYTFRELQASRDQLQIDEAIIGNLTSGIKGLGYGLNTTFILFGAFIVFFMQTGFAIFVAGVVRAKNIGDVLLKSAIDTCISAICYYTIGYALQMGVGNTVPNGFIGNGNFALSRLWSTPYDASIWMWYWVFCATSTTIMAGSVAERATFVSYCIFAAFYSIWVYPVSSHWHWSPYGWLSPFNPQAILGMGCIDFAGSGVVHTMGGFAALVGGYILGPRVGRFDPGTNPGLYRNGQNPPLYLLGTFLLWFAWLSFNCGSNLQVQNEIEASIVARTAVCTTLAAAAAGVTNSLFTYWRTKTWQLLSVCSGILGGLVAITAGCSVLEPWAAIICGAVAGPCVFYGGELVEWLQIDDPAEAFPIHGISGIWGIMFVGLLAKEEYVNAVYRKPLGQGFMGIFYGGHGQILLNQFISVVVMIGWVTVNVGALFMIMHWLGILRVKLEVEAVGIDSGLMGGAFGGAGFGSSMDSKINDTSIRVDTSIRAADGSRTADYSARRGAYRSSNNNPSGSLKYQQQLQFETIMEAGNPGPSTSYNPARNPRVGEIREEDSTPSVSVGVVLSEAEGSNISIPVINPILTSQQ